METLLSNELFPEQIGEQDGYRESFGGKRFGFEHFKDCSGERLAESIGVDVTTERDGVLVITDSLS